MSKSVTFTPGQSTASVNVSIIDNDISLQPNVTFTVAIIPHEDVNVIVLSNSTVTIVENDDSKLIIHIYQIAKLHAYTV